MKREEAVEILDRAKRILVTIQDIGHSSALDAEIPYFMVWAETETDIIPVVVEDIGLWKERGNKRGYFVCVLGTNRIFEILYRISDHDLERATKWYNKTKYMVY